MALVLRPPGSTEALPDRLADLGQSRKRVAVAAGLFALAAFVLGSVTLACVLDSLFHLSPLARGVALAGILTGAGIIWLRGVARPLALRTDALSVALELEARHPGLNDAVASAVSFAGAGDAEERGVSPRLQAVAVRAAQRLADRHDFDQLVPTGACWRAAWACLAACLVAVVLVVIDSGRAATALGRLADPFGGIGWPTESRIDILTPDELPTRMARGEPFDLTFVVRGAVKDRATLYIHLPGAPEFEKVYPLAVGTDPRYPAGALVVDRLDPLPASFSFRIVSHDADTGWQKVDVVPPPRLVAPGLRIHATPPAYTNLPAGNLPDAASAIEVPAGTVLRLQGETDLPLSAAVLVFRGDRPPVWRQAGPAAIGQLNPTLASGWQMLLDQTGSDNPVSIAADGRTLSAVFTPVLSGQYALKLTDVTGLSGTRPFEVRLVPDPAPTVTLLHPAVGKDPTVLTPDAALPIQVSVDDRLYAVRRTFLEYRVGREGRLRVIPLGDARWGEQALPGVGGGPAARVPVRPMSAEATVTLPVSAFLRDDGAPVRDGDVLFVRGAADDWDDVTAFKEPGRSGEVEIRVASVDAIEGWLLRELAALRPELIRARDHQRDARQKTTDAQPAADGTLAPADRDKLLAAEQIQRQIRARVSDPRDGLRTRADLLAETIRANKLPKSTTADRAVAVAEELGRLADRDLAAIEPHLSDARQTGSLPPRLGQELVIADSLRRAGRHQKEVEDGLTNLLDLLALWGGAAEVRGEAKVLRDTVLRQAGEIEQAGVRPERDALRAEQAADRAGQLLTRSTRFAAEQDRKAADARGAAADKDLEAAGLRAKADALPPGTPDKSALAAHAAALAAEAANLRATAARAEAEAAALRLGITAAGGQSLPNDLKAAAAAARAGQPATAVTALNSAASRLEKLAAALAEKEPDLAPELAKPLKDAADEFDTLAMAQDDLRKRTEEAARIADPAKRAAALKALADEQDKLAARGKELLQRLTRERNDGSTRDARAALEHMEAARDDLEAGRDASKAQSHAVEKLDGARDRLDTAVATAGQHLSDEKRRKIADRVKGLLDRQKAAVTEAERLHGLLAKNKKWEREPLGAYVDLADREKAIAEEVKQLGEKELAPLPVLALLLSEAAEAMTTAEDKIRVRKDDAVDAAPGAAFDPDLEAANDRAVTRPMKLAARRLEQLHDALKPDDPKANPKKKDGPPPPMNPPNPMNPPPDREQDLIPPLAQLKVLRSLQAELNERTAEFAKDHPDPAKLTEDDRVELKSQAQAQRNITVGFEKLAKLFQERMQDIPAPEKMP